VGGIVYSTSDPRMRRADKGISDLLVILPHRKLLLFHESKAGRGVLTDEQREFGELVVGLTSDFTWGDAEVARRYLMEQVTRHSAAG
jgi:hypothetical protein